MNTRIAGWWKKIMLMTKKISGSQEFFFDEIPELAKINDLVVFSEKMRYITPQVAWLFWGIGGIVVLL